MKFDLEHTIEVLSSTPATIEALLSNMSSAWTSSELTSDSQPQSPDREWSAYDVVGHLIHGEETDWIPRARIILEQGEDRTFVPFDRFAQFENSKGKSLGDLLEEFAQLRQDNVDRLRNWNLTEEQFDLEGMHPELGRVTLRQLLATWVVHDLDHIRQIVTVVAKRYDSEVGPWKEYLSILK
jgi:hypothetical protein